MFNQNIFNITLGLIVLYLLIQNFKFKENAENTDSPVISPDNLLAIKNLGELAAQLKNGDNITIPGNVVITGNLNVNNKITTSTPVEVSNN